MQLFKFAGIMDFVPNQVRPARGLTSAVHETVDRTMNKVNDWLMTQEDISVVNLQTVEYTSEAAWSMYTNPYIILCFFYQIFWLNSTNYPF